MTMDVSEESGGHGSIPEAGRRAAGRHAARCGRAGRHRPGRPGSPWSLVLVALVVVGVRAAGRRLPQERPDRPAPVPAASRCEVTVTHCLALMGGTGSSPAGYECTGTYTYHGTHFIEGVPGSTYHPDRAVVGRRGGVGRPGPAVDAVGGRGLRTPRPRSTSWPPSCSARRRPSARGWWCGAGSGRSAD